MLELENPKTGAFEKISNVIEQAVAIGAEGIALGCAGMAEFAFDLQERHRIPVVDGVSAAVGLAQTLVRCRLSSSRRGVWARPTRMDVLKSLC